MSFREFIPEFIVIIHFFQCGVWQALMIYLPPHLFGIDQFLPQIMGIVASVTVAVIFFSVKFHYKRVRFFHFYLLAIGNLFFVINGCYFQFDYFESIKGLYFGGVAHGLIYITGLTYMHFRLANNEFRIFKLSLCHIFYLIGIVATVHGVELMSGDLAEIFSKVRPVFLATGSICFMHLLVNETLHVGGLFDYKSCRDTELNAANDKKDLFRSALEFTPVPKMSRNNSVEHMSQAQDAAVARKPDTRRQTFLTLLMIFSKLKNYMSSHGIFINFFVIFSNDLFQERTYYIMHYLILAGALAGICITLKGNMKSIYIVSAICVCICLLVVIIFKLTSVFLIGLYSLPIILLYFHLGVSYFVPDCSIMEVSCLKFTEISLVGGYIAETVCHIITIATMKCSMFSDQDGFWHSSIIFIVILSVICTVIFKWLPKTWSLSILEVQHLILYNENRWTPKEQSNN
ncbi:hypothetical protein DMENIID0001_082470 [Sergentomyia squamirostris]